MPGPRDFDLHLVPMLRWLVDRLPHMVWTAAPDGLVTYVNGYCADYTGCSLDGFYDGGWLQLVHPDDVERVQRAWTDAVASGVEYCIDYRVRHQSGVHRWHTLRGVPILDAAGTVTTWLGTATEIEAQKQLESSIRDSQRATAEALTLLESVEAAAPVGAKLVDRELRVRRINERLAKINGRPVEDHIGRPVAEIIPHLWPTLEDVYRRALAGEATYNLDLSSPSAAHGGRVRNWLVTYYPVRVDGEIFGVGNVVVDVTERREADEFRAVVMDNMAEGLYALDRDGLVTYANPAACRLLGWAVEELLGRRMHELVHYQRADGTPLTAHECDLLRVRIEGHTVRNQQDTFTRKDGSALPVAYSSAPLRSNGEVSGVVVVFRDATAERDERAAVQRELEALSWIGRLRDALDEDRFCLDSEPIVPLADGTPGEELLLRMRGRDGDVVYPGAFLPVAEKYGLIVEIDRWVVGQAIQRAVAGTTTVAVNVSAASIGRRGDLLPFIREQLAATGADPTRLIFEITETALMSDMDTGEQFARDLAELGCGLALDDFGTGYGSFTYLKRLPATHLKIDIEFVRDLVRNSANRHVVEAVVGLARRFGLHTVAEGVEDEETLAALRSVGVDFAQGYFFSRSAHLDTT
jgi:PAS domain S-box-containing protein